MSGIPQELGTRRSLLLWLGVLGAPLAWVGQLVFGYGLDEARCGTGSSGWGVGGTASQAIVFGAALTVAAAATLASALSWRRLAHVPGDDRGRVAFLVTLALLASVLFDILIVLTGVYVLAVEACRQA